MRDGAGSGVQVDIVVVTGSRNYSLAARVTDSYPESAATPTERQEIVTMTTTRNACLALTLAFALLSGCASSHGGGARFLEPDFDPPIALPAHPADAGPLVAIDAAHHNYHTADGRYATFAQLARKDGYRVVEHAEPLSAESLAAIDVLVVANALAEENVASWTLPTPSAFTAVEIEVLVKWVEGGGALLLIADHMPFPGAAEELWKAFGVYTLNGYAVSADGGRAPIVFDRESGTLIEHPITEGVESVASFTGQGFRAVSVVEPLLVLPQGTLVRMTTTAGELEGAPTLPADHLLQGAVLRRGEGRVAFFGEAAMFSAQRILLDGTVITFGMNAEGAEGNVDFVRNVLRWLSEEWIDDAG